MKVFFGIFVLIAGISASALPNLNQNYEMPLLSNERFISDTIISVIEGVSETIKESGLDPLVIKKEVFSYALPVPVIFNAAAFVEEVLSTGLSNIVVNNMNYSIWLSRLTFDIELPHLHLSAGAVVGEATLFDNVLKVETDGRIDIRSIRVVGEVRVNIGIISGISITRVDIDFSIASIDTNIRLLIQEKNFSEHINNFLGKTVPDTLSEFRNEINELISIIILDIANDLL